MNLRTFCLFFMALVVFIPKGMAQEKKEKENFSFGKVTDVYIGLDDVVSSVGAGSLPSDPDVTDKKATQGNKWLRIDVPFQTKKKITPELKFKFYLEGYELTEEEGGAKSSEKFVILTGEAIYRDIPKGDKNYAGVFLSPASMVRFSGLKSDAGEWKTKRLNLRVDAWEGGAQVEPSFDLMAEKDMGPSGRGGKKDPDWYKSADAQQIPGALLPVQDTPFWPKDYKHYPQPKNP